MHQPLDLIGILIAATLACFFVPDAVSFCWEGVSCNLFGSEQEFVMAQ
jgi:hypothetical protein